MHLRIVFSPKLCYDVFENITTKRNFIVKANYHTHTTRCKHASGTEREYVEAAIANGIQVLGFSEHTPYTFPEDYHHDMRMFMHQMDSYVNTVLSLKKEYEKDITIHLGLEVEYFPHFFDSLLNELRQYPIEYFLLAQHFLGNGHITDIPATHKSEDPAYLEEYCNLVTEAMATGRFTYLAHPDVIHFMGKEEIYNQHMRKLCRTANAHGLPIEINFLGIRENRLYPRENFWKIAGEEHCQVIFGIDAHQTHTFAYQNSHEKAMELVNKYNLNLIEDVTLKNPLF